MPTKTNTLEDHDDDDDSDDELLEMHNYHVDFLLPLPTIQCHLHISNP